MEIEAFKFRTLTLGYNEFLNMAWINVYSSFL
jgi:hypothetical protein